MLILGNGATRERLPQFRNTFFLVNLLVLLPGFGMLLDSGLRYISSYPSVGRDPVAPQGHDFLGIRLGLSLKENPLVGFCKEKDSRLPGLESDP